MTDQSDSRVVDALGLTIAGLILSFGVILILLGHIAHGGAGEISKEAGFVLVGTVLVTFVYEFVLRRQHDRQLLRLVENSLMSKGPLYGLTGVEDRLSFQGLFDRLERGDQLLWLDTYCPDQPNFQEALRRAIDRGATVRMLAVDPNSTVAQYRANEIRKDLGYSVKRFSEEARGQIEHLREVLADIPEPVRERVRLRFYSDLPCIPMYIHVRNGQPCAAFTSYFLGNPTFSEPHLKWGASPAGFLRKFYDYFSAKWDDNADSQEDLYQSSDVGASTVTVGERVDARIISETSRRSDGEGS